MIIDSHVHIFPDALAEKAVARLQSGAYMPLASDGTLSGLLRSMEAGRIARSLTLPVCTRPDQVRSINRFAVELSRRPEIISFGALHPGCGDLRGEIAFLADAGIRGVKLHPDYQEFDADGNAAFRVYEALQNAGLIAFLHAGRNVNIRANPRCTPAMLARVARRMPELKIVAAHLGGWRMWDEVERSLVGTTVCLDTSFAAGFMPEAQLLRIMRKHGIEKVFFGSDSPWNSQSGAAQVLLKLPLSEREREALLWQNVSRLLCSDGRF